MLVEDGFSITTNAGTLSNLTWDDLKREKRKAKREGRTIESFSLKLKCEFCGAEVELSTSSWWQFRQEYWYRRRRRGDTWVCGRCIAGLLTQGVA